MVQIAYLSDIGRNSEEITSTVNDKLKELQTHGAYISDITYINTSCGDYVQTDVSIKYDDGVSAYATDNPNGDLNQTMSSLSTWDNIAKKKHINNERTS